MIITNEEWQELARVMKYGGVIQAPFASGRSILDKLDRYVLFDKDIKSWYGKVSFRDCLLNLSIDPSGQQGLAKFLNGYLEARKIIMMACRPELFGRTPSLRFTYHACEYKRRMKERGYDLKLITGKFLQDVTDYPPDSTIFLDGDVTMPDIFAECERRERENNAR